MPDLRLKALDRDHPPDHVELQLVLDSIPTYWRIISGPPSPTGNLTDGPPPQDALAKDVLAALPPGKCYEDKRVLVLLEGETVIGCADLVRGYPIPETAILGLLAIDERHQGRGLGKAAYQAIEDLAKGWECVRRMRIGVVAVNTPALGFWRSLGFQETGERKPHREGTVISEVIVMEKPISA